MQELEVWRQGWLTRLKNSPDGARIPAEWINWIVPRYQALIVGTIVEVSADMEKSYDDLHLQDFDVLFESERPPPGNLEVPGRYLPVSPGRNSWIVSDSGPVPKLAMMVYDPALFKGRPPRLGERWAFGVRKSHKLMDCEICEAFHIAGDSSLAPGSPEIKPPNSKETP